MRRDLYGEDHNELRKLATSFFSNEAVPNIAKWEDAGLVDRRLFQQAGELGLLGFQVPVEYGGSGLDTFTFNVVTSEAAVAAGFMNVGLRLQSDIIMPYFCALADDDQKERWLPGLCSGAQIAAIAMTEPNCGSDLAGIRTRAVKRDGVYELTGSKTFITNGVNADVVIVVARTGSDSDRRDGLTLLVVDKEMGGFSRGGKANKLGLKYSDTSELFFDCVQVPVGNRLGDEGEAFRYLSFNLPQERVSISVGAVAMTRAALDKTVEYVSSREVFGSRLSSFQNTKFELASVATELEAAEQLLDQAIAHLDAGNLTPPDAAKVKLFCTEVQGRAVDRCLQLFGGHGYMRDHPLADMFADARVTRIYGGTSEVMKTIIAKSLGL